MKKTVCGCVVIRFEENDDTSILLVTENGDEWGIPKGGIEPGEEPEACALRETLEETSIPVRIIGFLGTVGSLSVWYALPDDYNQKPVPQPGEILAAEYHSINSLPAIEERQSSIVQEAVERLRMASEL